MKEATYKGYLLGFLVIISTFNFAEREVLGIISQSIKLDLSLTDSQLGLLGGITFALFYATMGIPIARWADHGNRVTIIAVTTALWGVAVALCGAARSFVQLVLIRVVVGVGEAGCQPTTNSLLPDYFNRAERSRAMGIYALASPLSLVVGYGLAGLINQFYGWRTTFVVLGLPCLAFALLAALTLREPRRSAASPAGLQTRTPSSQPVNLRQTAVILWGNVTFRHLALAYVVSAFFSTGIFQWLPVFFIRSYGLQTGELGIWLSAIVGVGGFVGTYLGGELTSRFAGHNEPLQLKVMTVITVLTMVLSSGVYLIHNLHVAFVALAVYVAVGLSITGPWVALKQTVVPPHLRATSFALIFMFGNLIGTGIGPWAGGVLSDLLRPLFGEESLRYALLALSPGQLWVAWHLWRASKTVVHDVRMAELGRTDRATEQVVVVSTPAH